MAAFVADTGRCRGVGAVRRVRGKQGGIGTSTLFAACNAVIHVNPVEDERLDEVVRNGS